MKPRLFDMHALEGTVNEAWAASTAVNDQWATRYATDVRDLLEEYHYVAQQRDEQSIMLRDAQVRIRMLQAEVAALRGES